MDALDLLRMLAEADEDMEGALDALLTYKKFMRPLRPLHVRKHHRFLLWKINLQSPAGAILVHVTISHAGCNFIFGKLMLRKYEAAQACWMQLQYIIVCTELGDAEMPN